MATPILNIDARERILDELRRHLGVPETGGEASLSVVVDGVKLDVSLRATKIHSPAERAELRAQLDGILAEEPWRIGEGRCGTSTGRKTSSWSKRNANCRKPITDAVIYNGSHFVGGKYTDKISVWFHCPHHPHSIDSFKVVGVLTLSKADVQHYRKKLDDYNVKAAERRRIEQLMQPVNR